MFAMLTMTEANRNKANAGIAAKKPTMGLCLRPKKTPIPIAPKSVARKRIQANDAGRALG